MYEYVHILLYSVFIWEKKSVSQKWVHPHIYVNIL